jgi:hypothetical protein
MHLEARGHKIKNIKETLIEAEALIGHKINNNKRRKTTNQGHKKPIHPLGITSK